MVKVVQEYLLWREMLNFFHKYQYLATNYLYLICLQGYHLLLLEQSRLTFNLYLYLVLFILLENFLMFLVLNLENLLPFSCDGHCLRQFKQIYYSWAKYCLVLVSTRVFLQYHLWLVHYFLGGLLYVLFFYNSYFVLVRLM